MSGTETTNPKVSVIIPVYNSEKTVGEAVRSVLDGTWQDFEIVLVDDGSSDGSAEVCASLASSDGRIRLIRNGHGGVGRARNAGLDKACGEYVTFIDADDAVDPPYLERLLRMAEDHDLDWAACFCRRVRLKDGEVTALPDFKMPFEGERVIGEDGIGEVERAVLCTPKFTNLPSVVMSLYRRHVIEEHGIRFDEDVFYGEDMLFNYVAANSIRRFGFLPERLYQVTVHMSSSTHRFISAGNLFEKLFELMRGIERTRRRLGREQLMEERRFFLHRWIVLLREHTGLYKGLRKKIEFLRLA